jgi:hypothetical protein
VFMVCSNTNPQPPQRSLEVPNAQTAGGPNWRASLVIHVDAEQLRRRRRPSS